MNRDEVLQRLQTQFPGQRVLYAKDLARVLGRTEKGPAHLIAREQLPFGMKTVGGRMCVDIFQVAEWLASTDHTTVPTAVPATRPKGDEGGACGGGSPEAA